MLKENVAVTNMEFRKGILFIRLQGIITKEDAEKLKEQIDSFLFENGILYFVFNLEEVSEISKEAFRILKENYKMITNYQGKMLFCGIPQEMELFLKQERESVPVLASEIGAFEWIQV